MHVQTEFPPLELEMYITEKTSGRSNQSEVVGFNRENGSYDYRNPDYFLNSDAMISETPQTARGVSLVIFIAIGFAFNTFMIVSIVPNRRLRSVRNILLVHLGCSGLLFTILINLVTAVVSFTGKWFGGITICELYGFILTTLTLVTSWTITALSWDKYQTIACPLRHSFTATATRLILCCVTVWTIACTISLPPLFGGGSYVFQSNKGICFINGRSVSGKVYVMLYLFAVVYIPLAVKLFCYTHIYRIARNQSSRIAATMIQMTCVIQATIAPNSQATSLSIKGTKAMCTIVQLIGAFVIVYVPMSVIIMIEMFAPPTFQVNSVLASSVTMLFLSAPVVYSSVYGLRNKTLRLSFKRYIRRKVRYYCYKDKRRNSVKSFRSFRSSSFKAALARRNQNGATSGLRRTQSFPVRGTRAGLRNQRTKVVANGMCLTIPENEAMPRPHSYNALTPESVSDNPNSVSEHPDRNVEFNLPDDIPDIDADIVE